MMQVLIRNVTPLDKYITDGDADCSYHVAVKLNSKTLWEGDVHHHDRMDGWGELLRKIAGAAEGDRVHQPLMKPAGYRNLLDGSTAEEARDDPA